ncbi:UvrD-helicase domain-containing protein, partial [Clostridium sp. MT-14]
MSINILKGLNEAQKEAVTTTEGYIRVIAGAGSGKTKALTSRYVYLVNELGISTANILCVTFTNKAAQEMKKRIRTVIGDNDTGLISTFHGFCRLLLKEDIHTMYYPDDFIVMDTEDVESILKIVYEQANITSRQLTFSKAKEMIGFRKIAENPPIFKGE